MARTIKRISHDLMPLAFVSAETSDLVWQALKKLEGYLQFDEPEARKCFDDCIEACKQMTVSAGMVKDYVTEVDQEAEKEGILKEG